VRSVRELQHGTTDVIGLAVGLRSIRFT